MMVVVREVSAEIVWPLRHKILRPGKPFSTAQFAQDDDPNSVHVGAFWNDSLVGVVSLLPNDPPEGMMTKLRIGMQLRGMATDVTYRGHGVGRMLLGFCEERSATLSLDGLWCQARLSAAGFYHKHGWKSIGSPFAIPGIGPHVLMYKLLEGSK